jgi:hypothetical protein
MRNRHWENLLNRANLKDGAEIIGVLAIVLSLIFVGLQIKQSREIALAAQYQARSDTWIGVLTAQLQSDVALRVQGSRARNLQLPDGIDQIKWEEWHDETPVEEIGYHHLSALIFLRAVDNIYFQYQSGFLDQESWLVFRKSLGEVLSRDMSYVRLTYLREKDRIRPAFRAEIEQVIAEIDGTPPPG